MQWNVDMNMAPRDEDIIVMVPTGDEYVAALFVAYWDEDEGKFDGAWRWHYVAEADDVKESRDPATFYDPIAWLDDVTITEELRTLAVREMELKAEAA